MRSQCHRPAASDHAFRHGLEIQRRPEYHRHPGVDIRAKLCRRLAALVHDFELVGCALVLQSAVQGLDDTGRIAAVAGVVVGVAGVDLPRVRAVEFSVLLPVRSVGQVTGDEGIRVDVDAHGLEQHDAADALAAIDPALSLVDVRGRNDFFIKMPPNRDSALSKQSEVCYYVG